MSNSMFVMSGKPSVVIRIYNNRRRAQPLVVNIFGETTPEDVKGFIEDALAREGARIGK